MPTYLAPGVFVEEVDSGSRPIEGVGTAVAAFVGLAETGPFNTPTLVSNWTQFTANFGGFVEGSYLAQSVYGYVISNGHASVIFSERRGGRKHQAISARVARNPPSFCSWRKRANAFLSVLPHDAD